MGDIVATIQGEQDRVIRASDRVLVVPRRPGIGKTAVVCTSRLSSLHAARDSNGSGVLHYYWCPLVPSSLIGRFFLLGVQSGVA